MFFALGRPGSYLSDTNSELDNLYQVIRDDVETLITDLRRHRNDAAYFYVARALNPDSLSVGNRLPLSFP